MKRYNIIYKPFTHHNLRFDIRNNDYLTDKIKTDILIQDKTSYKGNLYHSQKTGNIFSIEDIRRGYSVAHVVNIEKIK